MRERVYILPTWTGLVYFACAVVFFVWGAFAMHPLLGFLGFYLLIFFVFAALQTNDNLKGLVVDAGATSVRIHGTTRGPRFALRLVWRRGKERREYFLKRLTYPVEVPLPQNHGDNTRVVLATSFPIGLFRAWKPARRRPTGSAASATGVPGDIIDHREFRPGDRPADVDWKRSARRGEKWVKVRERLPPLPDAPPRRRARWLRRALLAQPLIVYWLWYSPIWFAQALLLADLALLWFSYSHFLFPLDESGHLPAMLISLLRVFVISVISFALLALLSPDSMARLFPSPRRARVGFTRIAWMDPGQVASVSGSNVLVFRARLDREVLGPLYWRGLALEQSDNGLRWFSEVEEAPPALSTVDKPVRQQILMADEDAGAIALDRPLTLPAAPVSHYYEAASDPKALREVSGDVPSRYLNPPRKLSPEIRALAEQWRRASPDLESFAARAQGFFNQGFRYRLDPGTYVGNGLVDFLLKRKEGFCEHFAGAFATLLRLGGFPSRVVKGFKGAERNALDGTYRVRAKNAHVWVEAYSAKKGGWLRYDPTDWAAERVGADETVSWWQGAFEAVQPYWQVVADRWGFAWRARAIAWGEVFSWLARGLVIGILLAMIYLHAARETRVLDENYAYYEAHCREMAKRGIARLPNEGPLAYAQRCEIKFPELASTIRSVTARYLAERYRVRRA